MLLRCTMGRFMMMTRKDIRKGKKMAIVKYEHFKNVVSVKEELQGKHRDHCLCFAGCKHFKPGAPENCPIAQGLFEFDCMHGLVTPVWECPKFEQEQE